MNMPMISVVIPAYNAERWISGTIESVLAQDFKDFEIIVVNDGSTDHTQDVVSKYRQVHLLKKANGGPASARNAGIRAAQGDYIAFLDSDDLWTSEKLYLQVALLQNSSLKWCYSDGFAFNGHSGQILYKFGSQTDLFEGDILRPLLFNCFIASPTPLIHKSVFDEVGYFDEDRNVMRTEDWDMWLRIAARYPIGLINKPLVYYRVHSNSITYDENPFSAVHREIMILDHAVSRDKTRLEPFRDAAVASIYIGRGRILARRGYLREARRFFDQAIFLNKKDYRPYLYWIGCLFGKKPLNTMIKIRHAARRLQRFNLHSKIKTENTVIQQTYLSETETMKNRLLVSVIITAYNAESTIAETLESVFSQTYDNLEVIVADDGSTDRTAEIIKTQYPTVKYFFQHNRGQPAARNLGIRHARGSLIAFLDSDDLWLSNKIAKQVEALRIYPDAGLCYCDCYVFQGATSNILYRYNKKSRPHGGFVIKPLLLENFISSPTPMIRREVFDVMGLWVEQADLCEDWMMWLNIAARFPIIFCRQPLALYRLSSQSKSQSRAPYKYIEAHLNVIDKTISAQPEELESLRTKAIANVYSLFGKNLIHKGNMTAGRQYLVKAIRLNLGNVITHTLFLVASFLPKKMLMLLIDLKRKCSL